MAILSITAAAKAAGVSRTTIYEKIKDGELSRTPEGIDTAELLRVFGELKSEKSESRTSEPVSDTMTLWLREKLDTNEQELKQTRGELSNTTTELQDTKERLAEHREAARMLEDKSREWEQALAERQAEIKAARNEAAELSERLKREAAERAKAEAMAKALESRGVIARLLNRKPATQI